MHRLHPDDGTVGVTAIDKRAVDGPVQVRRLGLHGDLQADRAHHGGPDKAVYVLDTAEADHWAGVLGTDVGPGRLGENLRVAGYPVDDAEIGERWRVGGAELEVTGPRTPCATFARWVARPGWVREFTARGRTGVYLRVLSTGPVAAGDTLEVLDRPGHGVTVAGWFTRKDPADAARLLAHEAATGWQMAGYLRTYVLAAHRRSEDAIPGS
ncbi:MOSC domain-containing protein [Georgenia sp. TF02-10]|uniref:MOSC domain-containing protein n=1 Tax=Georgenia sp. TF02-10 TaxID=2917725 RepID=UPI001FA72D60|nr:MOSC domain-containing protein [Georgenia sp. TF02-10]UNX53621.1 MOSC domain-containing protein [Georgenia sp. TF02-10]